MRPLVVALGLAFSVVHAADETTLDKVEVHAGSDGAAALDAYRSNQATSGALGSRSVLDTPFSLNVVTDHYIENTQATTINDLFKTDAAVTPIANGYVGESSGISIRGQQLDLLNGFKIDGYAVPNWASDLPLEHYQQVELLKGLSGFMYGFGSPGGIANFVNKRPGNDFAGSVTAGYASDGVGKLGADVGGRFGTDQMFGVRVNAVHEQGDTYVDGGNIKRDSASVYVDARLTPDLLVSADALYQKRHVDGAYYGVVLGDAYGMAPPGSVGIPAPIDGRDRLASPFTYYETEYKIAGTELKWAINDSWDFKAGYRYSQQNRENADSAIVLLDNRGGYGELQYVAYTRYEYQTLQAMATGRFNTGSIGHEVVLGTGWQLLTEKMPVSGWNQAVLGTGNLGNPGDFANPDLAMDKNLGKSSDTTQQSLFASDTITFDEQWSLLVGLRYTDYEQRSFDAASGTQTGSYDRSPTTPTVALIYKPVQNVSLYGSYVEALQQGGSAPKAAANANTVMAPIKSRQYEVGVKTDNAGWSASAALFRLERGLEYVNSGNVYVQDGTEISQGLELSGKTALGRDWTLLGSAMWLAGRNESGDASVDGKRPYGAPKAQANAYVEYAVPGTGGLVLSGGAQYVGERPLEASNAHFAGSYTLFDLGARYATRVGGQDVTLRLNVDNVTNEAYWLTSYGFILTQGAPRTIRASAEFSF
ncbi:hypothetical protein BJP62_09945 [Jeongeupia sp. USM3]|nr:hypothetical protein BJP62_09945 [Jeongeupia sp. USM3]